MERELPLKNEKKLGLLRNFLNNWNQRTWQDAARMNVGKIEIRKLLVNTILRKFLKPDWKKIVICMVLFAWYTFRSFTCWINFTYGCKIGFPFSSTLPLHDLAFTSNFIRWLTTEPHVVIANLIFWYVAASMIVIICKYLIETTKREAVFLKKFSRPTRRKIIISSLGWMTVITVFVHYLAGAYGGTTYFPALLSKIYYFFDSIIPYVIFPFFLVTYFLYVITIGLGTLFIGITQIPVEITSGFSPEYLTTFGAVFTLSLLVIEWYLLSCLLSWGYKKIKSR